MTDAAEPHAEAVAHAVAAHARIRAEAAEAARRVIRRRTHPRPTDRWDPYQ